MPEEGEGRSRSTAGLNGKPDKFDPRNLDKSLIALPLLKEMESVGASERIDVIIDLNLNWPGDRAEVRQFVMALIGKVARKKAIHELKTRCSRQYVFASLRPKEIIALARADLEQHRGADAEMGSAPKRAIHRIWLDHAIEEQTNRSISTVKADAARSAFGALGEGIVWAVLDTGIDGQHPHFQQHETLEVTAPLRHRDFTSLEVSGRQAQRGCGIPAATNGQWSPIVVGIIAGSSSLPAARSRIVSNGTPRSSRLHVLTTTVFRRRPQRTDETPPP